MVKTSTTILLDKNLFLLLMAKNAKTGGSGDNCKNKMLKKLLFKNLN